MRQLSTAGEQAIADVAARHGFSIDAVRTMLDAVANGQGTMAQFSHAEFGGYGQWMAGGMTMVGDMFNNALKGRVDALCSELAGLLAREPGLLQGGSFQSQTQGGGAFQMQTSGSSMSGDGAGGLFAPQANWWGPELHSPNSSGAQNSTRYAYFAQARRLAVEDGGVVTIYDTLDHQIGGVSQQQSGSGSMSFTSQYGVVEVAKLPVVSVNGEPPAQASADVAMSPAPAPVSVPASGGGQDVFATIERLAELQAKGIISAEEFASKKAELLARL